LRACSITNLNKLSAQFVNSYHRFYILFNSVAQEVGRNSVGVILTGMGSDGAKGLLAMRNGGAHTISVHQSTCIVYGRPKAAEKMGASVKVTKLFNIPRGIITALAVDVGVSVAG